MLVLYILNVALRDGIFEVKVARNSILCYIINMPYKPNDPRLPENPALKDLKGMFGGMTQIMGVEVVPPKYEQELQKLVHRPIDAEPNFLPEKFSGGLSEAMTNIVGVAKLVTPNGHKERATERAERLERRLDVATFIALRILQPRITGRRNEKISWIGTHKMTEPTDTRKHPGPNSYRPSTRSELSVNKRLERSQDKTRTAYNNVKHIEDSYIHESGSKAWGRELLDTGVLKSKEEKKHFRRVSKDLSRQTSSAIKRDKKFENIANARDFRGRLVRARLKRANRVAGRISARNEPIVDIDASVLRSTSIPRVWH